MKHTRGRSPTERKSSTNAAKKQKNYNGLTAVEKEDDDSGHGHDAVDYPCDYWLQKMALFGDSSLALIGSFLLLGVAIVVSLHLDSDSNGSSFSSHLAAVIQLLPGWITASTTSWTNVDGSTINGRAQNDLTNGDSFQTRCSKPSDGLPAALQPGELNKMFHRITSSPIKGSNETEKLGYGHYSHDVNNKMEYSVLVHSHPGKIDYVVASSIKEGQSPWIITIDNFLSEEECESLIKIGHQQIFQRSIDVGKQNLADGRVYGKMTQRRTSESSWCTSESGCRDQDVPGRIHQRISNLLNIPSENSEDLQLLKYEVGQFYNTHHDYIPHQKTRQCGPRILTFFMYLSDVESGGGTRFPDLNVTIQPKKGRALLFPNVLDTDPMISDDRMRHEALPVTSGTKYAANAWYHAYNYQLAVKNGCN